jgi:hypothetical protein
MGYSLTNVLASAVWVAAGLAYSSALAQSNPSASTQSSLRERLAAAVETVEGACASDLKKFEADPLSAQTARNSVKWSRSIRALTAEFTPSRLTSVGGLGLVPKS